MKIKEQARYGKGKSTSDNLICTCKVTPKARIHTGGSS